MANKVNPSPVITTPALLDSVQSVQEYLRNLVQNLITELSAHASRLNSAAMEDGTEIAKQPEYLKTALPSASTYKAAIIMVTNESGGYTPAFSDGTNWRRVADRAIVS